jgi:SSS family solute:Na+ symporter
MGTFPKGGEFPLSIEILLAGIALWFAAGAVLSAWARRGTGAGVADYFLAGRTLGGLLSALSYSATTYSAFMMVGLVGLAYRSGISALGFELTYLGGTVLLLSIFAPRYWVAGRELGLLTPAEWLTRRYRSRWVGAASALLCLIMLIPYASVQLMGAGYLLETLSGGAISYGTGMGITAAVTLIFALWAGLRSVAFTDALQAATMLIGSLLLVTFVGGYLLPGGWTAIPRLRPDLFRIQWSFPMFLGLTLPWTFFALTNPQVVQRLYVPRDIRSIRRTILGFAAFGLLYTLLCVSLGFGASVLLPGLENPDGAMPALLTRVPQIIALVVTLSILAAAVSTLNGILLTLGSLFARDLLGAFHPLSERRELTWGKTMLVLLTAICLLFGTMKPGMIAFLSALSSAGLMAQVPAVVGSFFWKQGTAAGALTSIVAGATLMGVLLFAKINFLGQWPPLWGLLLASAVYVGVSLAGHPDEEGTRLQEQISRSVRSAFWP